MNRDEYLDYLRSRAEAAVEAFNEAVTEAGRGSTAMSNRIHPNTVGNATLGEQVFTPQPAKDAPTVEGCIDRGHIVRQFQEHRVSVGEWTDADQFLELTEWNHGWWCATEGIWINAPVAAGWDYY